VRRLALLRRACLLLLRLLARPALLRLARRLGPRACCCCGCCCGRRCWCGSRGGCCGRPPCWGDHAALAPFALRVVLRLRGRRRAVPVRSRE